MEKNSGPWKRVHTHSARFLTMFIGKMQAHLYINEARLLLFIGLIVAAVLPTQPTSEVQE